MINPLRSDPQAAEQEPMLCFVQVVAAPWHGSGNKLTHSIYGLTTAGRVYKHTKKGWQWLGDKAIPAEAEDEVF